MSILSETYNDGFDGIVWDELYGDGAMLRQVRNDINDILRSLIGIPVDQVMYILGRKLQQYANSAFQMKCVRIWFEIKESEVHIDVQLPHSLKTKQMVIEFSA